MDNNGWPDKPGVPLNPERGNTWHWLRHGNGEIVPRWWSCSYWQAVGGGGGANIYPHEAAKAWPGYIGPCPTPAEVDARVKEARREALEKAAVVAEGRYELWHMPHPDDARPFEVCDDASACRDIAAAIRALSATPPGTYTSEAEQERDEFFNRLGRITEELRLPMDATASRIIEAIRERVNNERDACASISVQVKVPDGAETWTPLEAWEEALLVFDDAFRDAIRSRAMKGEGDD